MNGAGDRDQQPGCQPGCQYGDLQHPDPGFPAGDDPLLVDLYIDLYDFADHIYANITDATIRANAQAVKTAVKPMCWPSATAPIRPARTGCRSFSRPTRAAFKSVALRLCGGGHLAGAIASLTPSLFRSMSVASWGTLLSHYIQIFPGGPDVSQPPAPVAPQVVQEMFMPVVRRK